MIEQGGAAEHFLHRCHHRRVPTTQIGVAGSLVVKKPIHRSHSRDIPSRDVAVRSEGATRVIGADGSSTPARDCGREGGKGEVRLGRFTDTATAQGIGPPVIAMAASVLVS